LVIVLFIVRQALGILGHRIDVASTANEGERRAKREGAQ